MLRNKIKKQYQLVARLKFNKDKSCNLNCFVNTKNGIITVKK